MLSRPLLLILSLALLRTAPAGGQTVPAAPDSATREARWAEDLRVLTTELDRRHPDLYHVVPKPDFAEAVERLRREIPQRDDAALTLGILELVASIGDAHTGVYVNFRDLGFHRLPIAPYWFDDGVYIRDADTSLMHLVGARIEAVDGHTMDTVTARLSRFVAAENRAGLLLALPRQLTLTEQLFAVGLTESVDHVSLTVVGRDGVQRTETVASIRIGTPMEWALPRLVPTDSIPLFRRHTDRAYWFEFLEHDATLYVAYNRAANDPSDPMDAFAERAVQLARERNAARIVVDFRRNSGGNSSVFNALQRRVLALKRERPHVQLVGLIGRQTFSSGMWNALAFQRTGGATLYGEPTGGKPNHFGEVRQLTLPHSRLVVHHSTRRWRLLRDADPSSLMPDVAVPNRAAEYFALRDPVLERALAAPR